MLFTEKCFGGLDLANGGVESTQEVNNPLPTTLLYRHFRRRGHHLSPEYGALKSETNKNEKMQM